MVSTQPSKVKVSVFKGLVDLTSSGNAYLISEEFEEDVFVQSNRLGRAFHGDEVEFTLLNRRRGKKTGRSNRSGDQTQKGYLCRSIGQGKFLCFFEAYGSQNVYGYFHSK